VTRLAVLALALACPAWGAWSTCASITVAPGKLGASTLTSFPMVVAGTYAFMGTVANGGAVTNASGFDVNFFSDSGCTTKLSWKTVAWSATGVVQYKVGIPSLSTTSNGFYVGVGNSAVTTDQSTPTAVFDSFYKGVYAGNDNAASTVVLDSTSNAINGTNVANTNTKSVAGPFAGGTIGTALTYNGTSDLTNLTNNALLNLSGGAWTLEYWIKELTQTGNTTIFSRGAFGSSGAYVAMGSPAGTQEVLQYSSGTGEVIVQSSTSIGANTWHHIMITSPGTTTAGALKFYLDGAADGTATSVALATGTVTAFLAADSGSTNLSNISLAEFRISTGIARSADWALADYNNQFSPATFYSISGLPLSIGTTSLANANRNAAYSQSVSASGGTTPYVYSISVGSLPTGLSLNTSTGAIAGTPTAFSNTPVSFTAKVTDALSGTATAPLTILVLGNAMVMAQSGKFSVTSTWASLVGGGPSGVPGDGDSVNAAGFALECDTAVYPCTFGTDVASNVSLILGTGSVTIDGGTGTAGLANVCKPGGACLDVRGNITFTGSDSSSFITFAAAGAEMGLDASHAAANTVFSIAPIGPTKRYFTATCGDSPDITSTLAAGGHLCDLTSYPKGSFIDTQQASTAYGGLINTHGLLMSGMGSATVPGVLLGIYGGDVTYTSITIKNSCFVNPGAFVMSAAGAVGSPLNINNTCESGSLFDPLGGGVADAMAGFSLYSQAGSTCTITDNYFGDMIYPMVVTGCTVNDSVYRKNILPGSTTVIGDFSRNFLGEPAGTLGVGNLIQTSWTGTSVNDNDFQGFQLSNPHFLYIYAPSGTPALSGNIGIADNWLPSGVGQAEQGKMLVLNLGATTQTPVWSVSNSLTLPDMRGGPALNVVSWTGNTSRSDVLNLNHSTQVGTVEGILLIDNATTLNAFLNMEKYNLLFNNGNTESDPSPGPFFIWMSNSCQAGSIVPTTGAASTVDYNYTNGSRTASDCSGYANVSAYYSTPGPGTPGTSAGYGFHDNHAFAPHFVNGFDVTGHYSGPMTFDVDYLGAAVAVAGNTSTCTTAVPCDWSAFASGFTFSVGQVVTYNSANMYNRPINLVVTQAHVKSAVTPGVTGAPTDEQPNWWWYFDSNAYATWLLNQTKGAIYVDGSLGCTSASKCTAQQVMHAWTRAQWAPTNPLAANIDGLGNYAGAVPPVLTTGPSGFVCLGFCALIHIP
jgi:hypothetical protein